LLAKYRNDDTC